MDETTVDENASEPTRSNQSDTNSPKKRGGLPGWLWAVIVIGLLVVIPTAACGAFGVALAASSNQQASTVSPVQRSIGLIRVEGLIFEGESINNFGGAAGAGSETIINLIERANADPNIEAIVIRVNSSGGGVTASDQIYHALTQVDKPLVVSMGTSAASGGYLIALPADVIYAERSTLTGSIGVVSQFVTAEELLDEVGVEVVYITSGDFKDFGAFNDSLTEAEIEYWQEIANLLYEDFVAAVVEGRENLTEEEVRELADGRIFIGSQAVELGLVDEVGFLDDAIARAAELAGIQGEPNVFEYEPIPSFFDAFLGVTANRDTGITLEMIESFSMPTVEYRYVGPSFNE